MLGIGKIDIDEIKIIIFQSQYPALIVKFLFPQPINHLKRFLSA
jgi:hypothetical protein